MDPISLSVISGLFAGGYVLNKNGKNPREVNIQDEYSDDEYMLTDTSNSQYANANEVPREQLYVDELKESETVEAAQMYYDSYMGSDRNLPYSVDRGGNASSEFPAPQPFYGSNVTQPIDPSRGQDRLNTFTGNPPEYIPKREQVPFFEPAKDLGNINGNIAVDFKDRYNVSNDKRFIHPIEQTRVGPGLNVGPDVVATGGFHSTTRFVPQITDEHRLNQLDSRIIPGMALNENRGVQTGVDKNNPYRYYVRSNESFLPTKADTNGIAIRPEYEPSRGDTRGVGGNEHDLYTTNIVGSRGETKHYVNSGYESVRPTNREHCNEPGMASAANSGMDNRTGYSNLPISDREEMSLSQQHSLGNVIGGYKPQTHSAPDTLPPTNREIIGERRGEEQLGNIRGNGHIGTPNVDSYRTDPTNREQTMNEVFGNPVSQSGHTTELNTVSARTTGKESNHEQYFGGAGGGTGYQAGMSYESLLKTEGYSLRAATDENRVANPGRMNVREDASTIVANFEQKMENNAARQGNIEKMNNVYQPVAAPELDPNKTENINNRFDTTVLDQLDLNPYNRDITR